MSLAIGLNPLKPEPSPVYPFTAIVGQEKMKLGLLLTLIHPRIGGLLIRGQRGTAKSTAVRGLINILPPEELVADCPFRCPLRDPEGMCDLCRRRLADGETLPGVTAPYGLVNLPLGATEDRLIGALDFEAALSKGERRFEPGLLARANQSILYVDEVNLLEDHLVDLLLDVAALRVNYVKREEISFSHRSDLTLIKAAQAIGAFRERAEVTPPDLLEAAELALPHRLKNQDLNQPRLEPGQIQKFLEDLEGATEDSATAPDPGELKKKPRPY